MMNNVSPMGRVNKYV